MAEAWSEDLRALRETRGLTQRELGERAGISSETIRAYEAGRRRPKRLTIEAILAALKPSRTHANRIRLALGFAPH